MPKDSKIANIEACRHLPKPLLRPLKWVGGSKKGLDRLPEDVKDVFGSALLDVQYGETPDRAKPFGKRLPHEMTTIIRSAEKSDS